MLAAEIVRSKSRKCRVKPFKQSLVWRYPASISAIFGLLHGFGFASALGDIGLPQTMKIPALAFFNVGVELGQLIFVFMVIGVVLLFRTIRNSKHFNWFEEVSSQANAIALPISIIYFVGVLSAYWFIERLMLVFG